MKARVPLNESRKEMLKDPELAAMYLQESLQEGNMGEFKQALKHVADARLGGMAALSKTTRLNRESLYRALSEKGNPRLDTLTKVLSAVGLRIGVNVQHEPKHP